MNLICTLALRTVAFCVDHLGAGFDFAMLEVSTVTLVLLERERRGEYIAPLFYL